MVNFDLLIIDFEMIKKTEVTDNAATNVQF